jgi:Zn-dependent protease with chaperone function
VPVSAHRILLLLLFCAGTYALAFAIAFLLVELLARPWRRTVGVHWTERARLAFGPGVAVIWFAILFSSFAAFIGGVGLETLDAWFHKPVVGWSIFFAAFAGALTVRFRWLREIWGPRVTFRSWSGGCLVILLAIYPSYLVLILLVALLPPTPNLEAMIWIATATVAVAFFSRGGGLLLLRWLGVARSAPTSVSRMVEQLAQKMNVSGRVQVVSLEWAQVNAIASIVSRTVGFSRPMLEAFDEDELRAVAAHELAHLNEPRWVRAVRVGHMFAYLPVAVLARYGGSSGAIAAVFLFFGIAIAYIRFTHAMEQRADRSEHAAIADDQAYMRSMIKLHESNFAPAVMPGKQTHPHLYDRLLSAGIQPDFPRPEAPSRTYATLAALAAAFLSVILLFIGLILALLVLKPETERHRTPTPSHETPNA